MRYLPEIPFREVLVPSEDLARDTVEVKVALGINI